MNDKQQIEAMAKDIHRVCTNCSGEMFDEYTCDRCQAKLLIDKGYRKLPENAVVLTREEYQKDFSSQFNKGYEKGSKETAEKFAKEMLSWLEKDDIDGRNCVIEVAKQFGVDLGE